MWALNKEYREKRKEKKFLDLLEESRKVGQGLVGFSRPLSILNCVSSLEADRLVAPGEEPGLENSAKLSTIFSFFGLPGFTSCIVEQLDSVECLKTYSGEINSSVSLNYNVLLSMILDSEEYQGKISTIEKNPISFMPGGATAAH